MIHFSNKISILCLILLIVVLSFQTGCKSDNHQAEAETKMLPQQEVATMKVQATSPVRQVEVMGTVEAADSASIAAKISGNITKMPVNLGSRVKKDDLLVTISAGEITAKLLQAQAQFEQADRNLKREQSLLKKNAATQESVKTLEESRRIAEAAYKEARTMLSYTSIEAPFDGVITRKMANVGDLATPGKPLLQLEDGSNLQVIADIPEALILGISIGDQLPVYLPAADLNTTGSIIEIAPAADPRSRTAPVKLSIPPETSIRSGQFVRVSLPGSKGKAIMIPKTAVLPFGQMDRVFLASNGTAQLQLVKTGLVLGDQIEILSGLGVGDEIITDNHAHLHDGQPISIR